MLSGDSGRVFGVTGLVGNVFGRGGREVGGFAAFQFGAVAGRRQAGRLVVIISDFCLKLLGGNVQVH